MSIEALAFVKMLELGERESNAARLIMFVIGEHTFNDSARCKIGQQQIAFEAGRMGERTLRRHLNSLAGVEFNEDGSIAKDAAGNKIVKDPIIRQHEQKDPVTGARVEDWIEIIGFGDWYREQIKRSPSDKGPRGQNGRYPRGQNGRPPEKLAGPPGQLLAALNESVQVNRTSEDARSSAQKDSISDFEVKAVLDRIREELGSKVFDSWFPKVSVTRDDVKVVFQAPQPFIRDWIRDKYGVLVHRLCDAQWPCVTVHFTVSTLKDKP